MAQRLLLQAQTALSSYADPEWAATEGWPAFADRLVELARAAEPGSDHQLAFVNALTTSVLLDTMRCCWAICWTRIRRRWDWPAWSSTPICAGGSSPALARSGQIDADGPETPFIDAEAERDPTAAGKRQAAAHRRPAPRTS